jgi:hypothetical protein
MMALLNLSRLDSMLMYGIFLMLMSALPVPEDTHVLRLQASLDSIFILVLLACILGAWHRYRQKTS